MAQAHPAPSGMLLPDRDFRGEALVEPDGRTEPNEASAGPARHVEGHRGAGSGGDRPPGPAVVRQLEEELAGEAARHHEAHRTASAEVDGHAADHGGLATAETGGAPQVTVGGR